jgi:hypothetical protein
MAVFLSSASVVDMISFKQPRAKSKPSNLSPPPREAEGRLRGLPRRLWEMSFCNAWMPVSLCYSAILKRILWKLNENQRP